MINSLDTSNPHQTQFSVYIIGEENVGKSALIKRYTEDSFLKDEKPKLQLPITKHTFINGKPLGLNLYDYYMRNETESDKLKGVILLFDINNKNSLEFLKKVKAVINDKTCIKLLVGNKNDISSNGTINKHECIELASFHFQAKFKECSALTGEGVTEVFKELQNILIERAIEAANKPPETSCCNLI